MYVLAWFGKGVVRSIGSVAGLMWMQLLPAIMQVGEQGCEQVHLQAVRWTVQVTCYNDPQVLLHADWHHLDMSCCQVAGMVLQATTQGL